MILNDQLAKWSEGAAFGARDWLLGVQEAAAGALPIARAECGLPVPDLSLLLDPLGGTGIPAGGVASTVKTRQAAATPAAATFLRTERLLERWITERGYVPVVEGRTVPPAGSPAAHAVRGSAAPPAASLPQLPPQVSLETVLQAVLQTPRPEKLPGNRPQAGEGRLSARPTEGAGPGKVAQAVSPAKRDFVTVPEGAPRPPLSTPQSTLPPSPRTEPRPEGAVRTPPDTPPADAPRVSSVLESLVESGTGIPAGAGVSHDLARTLDRLIETLHAVEKRLPASGDAVPSGDPAPAPSVRPAPAAPAQPASARPAPVPDPSDDVSWLDDDGLAARLQAIFRRQALRRGIDLS
jgi:hypothetical protein